MKLLLAVFLLAAVQAPGQSPALLVLEGPDSGPLQIREYDEPSLGGQSRTIRSQVEVLAPMTTGRTGLRPTEAARARLEQSLGVPHVQLPDGGRVFRYRTGGGQQWGFLLARPDGRAIVLAELAGTGTGGLQDPWVDRFGIGPTCTHALFATRAGTLVIARLDGGIYASTGLPSRVVTPAAAIEPASLTPGRTQSWFTTADARLWRCPLADFGQPADVTPPGPSDARLKDEITISGDGATVVVLYGPKDLWRLWLLGETGSARVLPPPASKYEEPGYLPDTTNGPRMLLNENGTRLLYTDSASRDEAYLLDTAGVLATTHLTSDANFQPYIGTVILPVFYRGDLGVAIGDPGRVDDVAATAGFGAVANITQTAGKLPPFASGTLDFVQVYATPTGIRLLTERTATGFALRATAPLLGQHAIVEPSLTAVPVLGLAANALPSLRLRTPSGDVLRSGDHGGDLLRTPPGVTLEREVRGPGYSMSRIAAGNVSTALFRLDGGGLLLGPPVAGLQQLVLTQAGGIAVNDGTLRYFGPAGSGVIPTGANPVVLSGLDS